MFVAHGAWRAGKLCVWAEDPGAYRSARGGTAPKPHPYAVPGADLPRVLACLGDPDRVAKGGEAELVLRLPGSTVRPEPSPDLVVPEGRPSRGTRRLLPWRVPVLAYDPAEARELLAGLAGSDDVLAGAELRYLAVLAEDAADLVRRGRMLPALLRTGGTAEARWRCVLTGADSERARTLAAALPPVLRGAGEANGAPASGDLVLAVLDAFADAEVRARGGDPLVSRTGNTYAHRWARALTGADARVRGDDASPAEAAALAEELDGWRAAAHAGDGPVRTFFRLAEPALELLEPDADEDALPEAPWRVELGLQATDDPSLVIPADAVWRADPEELGSLMSARPEETLLAGLGRAARLYSDLDAALHTATPYEVTTDAAGAYRFLKETAPLLSAAGFGVQLPRWAGAAKLGRRLTAQTKSAPAQQATVTQGFGREQIVDFRWDLALGDTTIDADELLRLAALKVPLVRLRGQWVELDDRQLTAALEFLKNRRDGTMTTADALSIALLDDEDDPLPVTGIIADGPLGDLLSGETDHRLSPVPTPEGLDGELRPYQQRGLAWLTFMSDLGLGTVLADDMGLGKCLAADDRVLVNGSLVTAQRLWETYAGSTFPDHDGEGEWAMPTGRLQVNALHGGPGGSMGTAQVATLYRQWINEPVRRVRLDDGSSVTITRRHRLLGPGGWTNVIAPGDRVCVPGRLAWTGEPVSPDLTRLLAWQIAEDGESAYGDFSGEYRAYLEARGYVWGRRSGDRRIPDFIMAADEATNRVFLREFFSAKGSVSEKPHLVEIGSASGWLMDQLVHMLRRFGIWMRVQTAERCATNGSGPYRPYRIGIIGGPSLRRFSRLIGFSDPVKQAELERACAGRHNPNAERVLSGARAEEYRSEPGSRWTGRVPAAYDRLDQALLGEIRESERTSRDVFYARVTDVEEFTYEGWVYDLEVAEHHNFVAGGMLCHNTVQTLGLVQGDVNRGSETPTLLICPMSLVGNWQREAARFTPGLRVYVHHGGQRARGEELAGAVREADLVITTYGTAARDQAELGEVTWRRVVVDEAQAIKNAQTRQARAVRGLPAGHRLALTGTPVENHLTELWSIMEFANPGLLGSAAGFRRRFAKPIESDGDAEASARLKRATGPFVLRREKTDRSIISDLPEKQEIKVWCNLTPEQASLYQATVDDMMARLENSEGIEYRGLVLATMAKLKQVCNHPAHLLKDGSRLTGRSGKLARLEEIVDEVVEDGDKALCFTQYAEFGAILQPYLAARTGRPVLFLHGGLGKAKRDELVERFSTSDEPAIFLLSLKAGGTGLNLTAASHVIHVDRWWNPAVEDQATDRAFRIGQRRNVQVRKFICVGTLEERIDEMIERKKKLAETIVGTGEDWLTSLDTAELRDVIRLAPEAVSS